MCGNLLQLILHFLESRKPRVLQTGQCSSWGLIEAGVPQSSDSWTFSFLICINDLTENLQSNPKFFADDNSLFAIINDTNATAKQLCEDLDKIKEWVFQWKMNFSLRPSKQAQDIVFACKIHKVFL